ncbi:MAG: GNAT family N-acetyltransferase [Defluviitaleaceae bacterium]|nr:GNAT family N-acetyltransferase [Defluviitaleaceae bacterium]
MEIDYSNYFWQNEKVRLRRATADDWDMFYYNYFDSDARFFLDNEIELPGNEENAKEHWCNFIENTEKSRNFAFTTETLDGKKVGGAYLNSIDERNGTFGIGIVVDRNSRGKGYGFFTMKIILNYAFNERRLHKYNTFVVEGNIASETMMKKLGCKYEGTRRENIYHKGKYWNEIHYGITASEFNEKWNSQQ